MVSNMLMLKFTQPSALLTSLLTSARSQSVLTQHAEKLCITDILGCWGTRRWICHTFTQELSKQALH